MHLEASQRVDDLLFVVVDLLHIDGARRLLVVPKEVGLRLLIEGELYAVGRWGSFVCFVIFDEVVLRSFFDDHLLGRRGSTSGTGITRRACRSGGLRCYLFVEVFFVFVSGVGWLITPRIFVLLGTIGLDFGELCPLATEQAREK